MARPKKEEIKKKKIKKSLIEDFGDDIELAPLEKEKSWSPFDHLKKIIVEKDEMLMTDISRVSSYEPYVINMFLVWILTAILQSCNVPLAITLWHWFGLHPWITVLLLILLG